MPKRKSRPRVVASQEKRPVETLTVVWMLTVMTTLTCEVVALATYLYQRYARPDLETARTFAFFLLLAAIILGFIALLLTPVVVRARRRAPPRSITILALVVGAAPIFVLCYLSMTGL